MWLHHGPARIAVVMLALLVAAACKGNAGPTKEQYEKIELGMAISEVEAIMGGPGQVERFSGQPEHETTYVWKNPDTGYRVHVTVVEGTVKAHVGY